MGLTDKRKLIKRWAETIRRWFPVRRVTVRTHARVSYLRIGHVPQVMATLVLIVFGGWVCFSSISYFMTKQILSAKDGQISNARHAYQTLMDEIADYQKTFIAIIGDLEENHAMMLELAEQKAALKQDPNTAGQEPEATEAERQSVIAMREHLKDNLSEIQENLHTLTSRHYLRRDDLDTIEPDMELVLAERNQALVESENLKDYVDELEVRLDDLQETHVSSIDALTERTNDNIATFERIITATGLEVAEVVDSYADTSAGLGGPFIAVPDGLPGDGLRKRLVTLEDRLVHLHNLQSIMQGIPLAAPLVTYYVTSKFGKRKDPINKKWSMHYGTDMGTKNKSAVYSTAPGVVSHADWKGKYGNLVEIDHGGGLKTRFGHLGEMHVKKGQEVGFYEKVGVVGSTGRSTGPHLHYEVVFNDKPINPMNFIEAGRHVFQEQHSTKHNH